MITETKGRYSLTGDGLGICVYLPGDSEEDRKTGQYYYVPLLRAEWASWMEDRWLLSKEDYQKAIQVCLSALQTVAEQDARS